MTVSKSWPDRLQQINKNVNDPNGVYGLADILYLLSIAQAADALAEATKIESGFTDALVVYRKVREG